MACNWSWCRISMKKLVRFLVLRGWCILKGQTDYLPNEPWICLYSENKKKVITDSLLCHLKHLDGKLCCHSNLSPPPESIPPASRLEASKCRQEGVWKNGRLWVYYEASKMKLYWRRAVRKLEEVLFLFS